MRRYETERNAKTTKNGSFYQIFKSHSCVFKEKKAEKDLLYRSFYDSFAEKFPPVSGRFFEIDLRFWSLKNS